MQGTPEAKMKIILFLHDLAMGGTTVNALELATALRDTFDHEVIIFASPGPMLDLVHRSGLRCILAPKADMHPCMSRVAALRNALLTERPDLLYVWETWAMADAFFATRMSVRVPMLLTDMQMFVGRLIPRYVPATFGTPELVALAKAKGIRNVGLLVPPVNLKECRPGAIDTQIARAQMGVAPDEIAVVMVSRLVDSMKGESLANSIEAVGQLGSRYPLRLVIVGDGSARQSLQARADKVNEKLGRRAVSLYGPLLDPRPAYAAADVVIGMGGSALRGMAFAKPLIVVGENGFATTLTPSTANRFLHAGLYGKGDGTGAADLTAALELLVRSPRLRHELSEFSLDFVRRNFSLEVVAAQLDNICWSAATSFSSGWRTVVDAVGLAYVYFRERRFLWRAGPSEPFVAAANETA